PVDQGRADLVPRDHGAGRRLGRVRNPHARRARQRRVGDQRVEDLHHERPPRRLHRPRHEDRPRRRLRRLHAVPGRHGPAGRGAREEAREARHARVGHRPARVQRRARAGRRDPRRARQGLLPHHVGAPGGAADRRRRLRRRRPAGLRQDAPVRARAQGVRPRDRALPGDPPQVRRHGDEDRVGAPARLLDRVAVPERRVPGARDIDGEAVRRTHRRGGRRRVHPDQRRRRLHEGVRDRGRVARHAAEPHRRRHRRDHARRDRALVRALDVGALLDHVHSYYRALNTGDPDKVAEHFTDDAVHYYTRLGPHEGARTIGEHTKWAVENLEGQWYVDNTIEDGEHAVIEWAMTWRDPETGEPRLDRGSEWFEFRDGRISEVRAYVHNGQLNRSGDLIGFDHKGRGYTVLE